jgi:hypothetical protein
MAVVARVTRVVARRAREDVRAARPRTHERCALAETWSAARACGRRWLGGARAGSCEREQALAVRPARRARVGPGAEGRGDARRGRGLGRGRVAAELGLRVVRRERAAADAELARAPEERGALEPARDAHAARKADVRGARDQRGRERRLGRLAVEARARRRRVRGGGGVCVVEVQLQRVLGEDRTFAVLVSA